MYEHYSYKKDMWTEFINDTEGMNVVYSPRLRLWLLTIIHALNTINELLNIGSHIIKINNLCSSAIQSEKIIFILRMWQRGSLSEHTDSKSWHIDSKLWCHERQVHFLLKCEPSARTAPRTRAFINLRNDHHAWTHRNSLTGIDRQWVQK